MPSPKYIHTVHLPEDVEELWRTHYQNPLTPAENFTAFVVRLIKQELSSEHANA